MDKAREKWYEVRSEKLSGDRSYKYRTMSRLERLNEMKDSIFNILNYPDRNAL